MTDRNGEDIRAAFGAKLRTAREAAGLSQMELAERIGSIQAYISRLERGMENPGLVTIDMLAKAVGKTIADLVRRRRPRQRRGQ